MVKRKPILLLDESNDSMMAFDLFNRLKIDYVEFNIKKFEESCCGELPKSKAPSVFAPEGIFKGLDGINEYISLKRDTTDSNIESESAYW